MALTSRSRPTKEESPKQLAEFLQQQQEPLMSECLLHECRYKKGKTIDCNYLRPNKLLKGLTRFFGSYSSKRRAKMGTTNVASYCTRIAAYFLNSGIFRYKACHAKGRTKNEKKAAEIEDIEDIAMYGCQNQRHVNHQTVQEATESLWDLLIINNSKDKTNVEDQSCFRHIGQKTALQQTRQLLFDCAREVVEKQMRSVHLIGSEVVKKKIICENVMDWYNQSVNEKKIINLLRSDLLSSYEGGVFFEGFREAVINEVRDKIMEEIIDQIVMEFIKDYM